MKNSREERAENAVTSEGIEKYFRALQDLKLVLDHTGKVSMHDFCDKHSVTSRLGTVLQKGGIVRLKGNARASEWVWISGVDPNRQMAAKVIREIHILNYEKGKIARDQHKVNVAKVSKVKSVSKEQPVLDHYELKIMFGLITLKIIPRFINK
jgi:hypothetical protein